MHALLDADASGRQRFEDVGVQAFTDNATFFTRAETRAWGYDDRAVARAVRTGEWFRIRRGYYVAGDAWAGLDDRQRHRLRARAVHHALGDAVALSHVSGVLEYGIAVWGVPLDRVHVTRLDAGAGRVEGDVVHHEGLCFGDDVSRVGGLPVVSAARCVLEAASTTSSELALVMLDSALATGQVTSSELWRQFEVMRHWPRTQHLHIPMRMADGGAESPGESRARWLFRQSGIPAPQLQYEVRDSHGTLVGVSDFAWPALRMLGEFDGRLKYGRSLRPGQQPGDAVFAEKVREDRLREVTGFGMIRLVWDDLDHPQHTARRLRTRLGLAAA